MVSDVRLQLLPFNEMDAAAVYRWYHDPAYAHFFRGFVRGVSLDECRRAPDILKANILIAVDANDMRVGMVTFAETSNISRILKFGLLVDAQCQHMSIGKWLTAAALEWAFDKMNAHRVFAEVLECDTRILNGAAKAGFLIEGRLRESQYINGKFLDEIVIAILHDEYDFLKRSNYEAARGTSDGVTAEATDGVQPSECRP